MASCGRPRAGHGPLSAGRRKRPGARLIGKSKQWHEAVFRDCRRDHGANRAAMRLASCGVGRVSSVNGFRLNVDNFESYDSLIEDLHSELRSRAAVDRRAG